MDISGHSDFKQGGNPLKKFEKIFSFKFLPKWSKNITEVVWGHKNAHGMFFSILHVSTVLEIFANFVKIINVLKINF